MEQNEPSSNASPAPFTAKIYDRPARRPVPVTAIVLFVLFDLLMILGAYFWWRHQHPAAANPSVTRSLRAQSSGLLTAERRVFLPLA